MFPVAERVIMEKSKCFFGALQALLAAYFIFNIEYPKSLRAVLIYLQCFIFSLKIDQTVVTVPHCVNHFNSIVSKI